MKNYHLHVVDCGSFILLTDYFTTDNGSFYFYKSAGTKLYF